MTAEQWTAVMDAGDVLSSVEASQAELVAAEARRFELAVLWVQLHAGEALRDERRRTGRRVLPGMERALPAGADGTPLVAEFAASEFGAVAGMSPAGAAGFQTDAVNVYYRHPLLWGSVMTGAGRVWQAQQVARMCAVAGLSSAQAEFVDAATTPYLGTLPWLRFSNPRGGQDHRGRPCRSRGACAGGGDEPVRAHRPVERVRPEDHHRPRRGR